MSGDILRLKSAKHYSEDGKSSATIKVEEGRVIVCAILGDEPARNPDEPFDIVAAMARIGWQPIPVEDGDQPAVADLGLREYEGSP
jgi:hypothetical protein